jgi:hypothetical protein
VQPHRYGQTHDGKEYLPNDVVPENRVTYTGGDKAPHNRHYRATNPETDLRPLYHRQQQEHPRSREQREHGMKTELLLRDYVRHYREHYTLEEYDVAYEQL